MHNPSSGSIELIVGPMFSGKTTKIIELYKKYTDMGLTCLVINYKFDKRYSDSDQIVSHAGDSIDAFSIEHLYDLYPIVIDSSYVPNPQLVNDISLPKWDDIDVILINEGQFFSDLYKWCSCAVDKHKKTIHIAALDSDFNRNNFQQISLLYPISDYVTKKKANCKCCSQPAIFSFRTNQKLMQVVDISNDYIPLCRDCYIKKTSPTPPRLY